jgi:F-box protein, helicase, 18
MPFTAEQQAVIESNAPRICVRAFAGTGKTSCLSGYARARPHTRFLYIAFNKAIQREASTRFGPNVVCKTTHALAFPTQGKRFIHKLGNMRFGDVATLLRINFRQAALVSGTLNNYLSSADDEIGSRHLPPEVNQRNFLEYEAALGGAQMLWKRMCDVNDHAAVMCHDGYLKLFVLERPQLNYGCILFDEFQDSTPLTSALLLAQFGSIAIVGDRWQSIYGFRGAREALDEIKVDETFHLTHSFRFAQGIAEVSNDILHWHGEKRRIIGAGATPSQLEIDRSQPYAQIGRTNMSVIQSAIEALGQAKRLHFVGGVEGYRLAQIEDGYRLFIGDIANIKDRFLAKFTSLSALREYVQEAGDAEMALLLKIVDTYQHAIPTLLKQLRARSVDAIAEAGRVFSTAHKSKGLEFEAVELLPDFVDLVKGGFPVDRMMIDPQQVNLMYVAATRAAVALQPCPQILDYRKYLRDLAQSPTNLSKAHRFRAA